MPTRRRCHSGAFFIYMYVVMHISPNNSPGLCLDRKAIDFGTMRAGTEKTLTIPMANSYQIGMELDLRPAGRDSSMLSIPYGLKLESETVSQFRIDIKVPDNAGTMAPELYVRPVIHGVEVDSIPVKVRIIR